VKGFSRANQVASKISIYGNIPAIDDGVTAFKLLLKNSLRQKYPNKPYFKGNRKGELSCNPNRKIHQMFGIFQMLKK